MALVKAMLGEHSHIDFYLVLNGMFPETIGAIRSQLHGLIDPERIRVWYAEAPVAMADPSNLERIELAEYIREAFIYALKPDYVLVTSLFEGFGDNFICSINKHFVMPTAVILYDLIPLINPESYLPNRSTADWYFRKVMEITKADLFLSISKASGNEAIENIGLDSKDVVNISGASDILFTKSRILKEERYGVFEKFGITRPFLMYASATDERKNHRGLISAYSLLSDEIRSRFQLVLAGGLPLSHRSAFEDHARTVGLNSDELVITGHLSDRELNILYNECHSFIFPSWHEGFGLPILEAMNCGKAVIASNRSSIPEVVGLDEALFDPFDVADMAHAIERLLSDDKFRKRLEKHALHQAKLFSWQRSAMLATAAMEDRVKKSEVYVAENEEVINRIRSELVLDFALSPCIRLAKEAEVGPEVLARHLSMSFVSEPRQLLVDVTELVRTKARSGIQRLVGSVLRSWLDNPPKGWNVKPVFSNLNSVGYYYAPASMEDILEGKTSFGLDNLVEVWPGDVMLLLDFSPFDVPFQMELYRDWRDRGVKICTVVYDLLPVRTPQFFTKRVVRAFKAWLGSIVQFDAALCISRAVASDMAAWVEKNGKSEVSQLRIETFPLGSDIGSFERSERPLDKGVNLPFSDSGRPIFLVVGTLERRKAHNQILSSFEILWDSGHDISLVFVGKPGWLVDEQLERFRSHAETGKRFFWMSDVSDETLSEVYDVSDCVIVASYGEGFGLPLVEAAGRGVPLIVRDIPVFREIAGPHATYFADDSRPDILANCIVSWLKLYEARKQPDSTKIKVVSWDESSAALFEQVAVSLRQQG